ncbi:MAG: DUF1178 family protein [Lautropia sp.]
MKVFNLGCPQDHRFEGWFASADAFETQRDRKLIECPICGSHEIRKLLAAPRLNLSSPKPARRRPAPQAEAAAAAAAAGSSGAGQVGAADHGAGGRPDPAQFQAMFLRMVRKIIASTEDVGDRFAEEARRIHYNEAPERAIRGEATPEQTAALRDEGIDVVALPVPASLKGTLQ